MLSTRLILSSEHIVAREHKSILKIVPYIISMVAGPLLFMICSVRFASFAEGEKLLVLFAFSILGFELVWLLYGVAALLNRAVYNIVESAIGNPHA